MSIEATTTLKGSTAATPNKMHIKYELPVSFGVTSDALLGFY
jgi:hypothetical protein